MEILKISSKSNVNSVAGALTAQIKEFGKSEMQAVGAGALNQAVKAVAIARGFVAPMGINLVCIPAFTEVEIDNENKSAIKVNCKGGKVNGSKNSLVKREQKQTFSTFLSTDAMKKKINEMVGGEKGQQFVTSIISAVSTNPQLAECEKFNDSFCSISWTGS